MSSPSSSIPVAAAPAPAEPQGGPRSSSTPVAAAPVSADSEQSGDARSPSSSFLFLFATALASAEPPGGARSPSSSTPVVVARVLAHPWDVARSPSSSTQFLGHRRPASARLRGRVARTRRHRVLISPPPWPRLGPQLRPCFPLLALTPTMTLRLVGGSSQLGPA